MISQSKIRERFSSLRWAVPFVLAVGLVGCQREEIRIYTAPKEIASSGGHHEGDGHDHGSEARSAAPAPESRPQLGWKLPVGWKETIPGQMSFATFKISDDKGSEAEASIARLANLAGRDSLIVNMLRAQVGLAEMSDDEAAKQFSPVQIGSEQGKIFEVQGRNDKGEFHIVIALNHSPEGTWFYRLSGDTGLVKAQKDAFVEFLKSIKISEVPAEEQVAATSPRFGWEVPKNWKSEKPGQMQEALFSVEKANAGKAQVSVSIFPNDTGGTLANVNRWRNQIGLKPTDQGELAKLVSPLDPTNAETVLVDMSNEKRRLVGAVVPRGGRYWFYKLLGDAEVVGAEKDSFIAFAKSQP